MDKNPIYQPLRLKIQRICEGYADLVARGIEDFGSRDVKSQAYEAIHEGIRVLDHTVAMLEKINCLCSEISTGGWESSGCSGTNEQ